MLKKDPHQGILGLVGFPVTSNLFQFTRSNAAA